MDGSGKAKSFNRGVTLIEVMISLLIFSTFLGLSGQFVNKGIKTSFYGSGAEQWLQLIEASGRAIEHIQNQEMLETLGTDRPPLNQIDLPADLVTWSVEWTPCSLDHTKAAHFTARIRGGKEIEWNVFHTDF